MANLKHDVRAIVRQFEILGEFHDAASYGSGSRSGSTHAWRARGADSASTL